MKIENHISDLLYRYQCVTVPGFGAFLTEIQSAQLQKGTNTFLPPKKLVSFNPNLKNNDGLLASHLANQEKITYDDALSYIQQVVGQWITSLQKKETLTFEKIGSISVNSELNWVFEPFVSVNYLTDSFGLTAVIAPHVERELLKQTVETLEEKAPIVFTPERKKKFAYLKYAAIITLVFGAAGTGIKIQYDKQIADQTLAVQKNVQEKVQHEIQEATFFIENPLPAVTLNINSEKSAKPFHIVAGSFQNETNAEKALIELQKLGFEASKLDKNKFGLYPVLYGSFVSFNEAQEKLREIHKSHNKEAWILIKEL